MGTTKATYQEWLIGKDMWDKKYSDRITHFADPMKDCLSIMYDIPRHLFDDRNYKDELWYCFNEKRFLSEAEACRGGKYEQVTIDMLLIKPLSHWIALRIHDHRSVIIKLRTLMQYFGTEIGRNLLGDNLWINATMYKAANIAETRRLCIIPDVRYSNENKAITTHFLYGGDIYISRNKVDGTKYSSETIDFRCKYQTDNNGTKMQLFYKALNIVSQILKS